MRIIQDETGTDGFGGQARFITIESGSDQFETALYPSGRWGQVWNRGTHRALTRGSRRETSILRFVQNHVGQAVPA